jgi:hypothetical protein
MSSWNRRDRTQAEEQSVEYWTQILSAILGFAAGFTVRFVYDKRQFRVRSEYTGTKQTGNIVGGSMAGRDVKSGND